MTANTAKTLKRKSKKSIQKNKGMDSDTRTLTMILVGLTSIAVLLIGGVATYSYLSQPEKPHKIKTVTSKELPHPTPIKANDEQLQTASLPQRIEGARYDIYEGARSTFDPDNAYESGEVILADPPSGFEDKIRPEGFRVTEHTNLSRLNLSIVRIATPPNMSVSDALRRLAVLLPGVTMDVNHHFEASAALGSNPRVMAGWEALSPTCGAGLVIGQIDGGVDMDHPALKGQNIHYKTFTKSNRAPGPPDHGTAVAAMLVGKPDWGGLLPGAELYAANMFEINEHGQKVGSAVGLLKSVDWIAGQHVDAVNLSIAGSDNKVVRKAFDIAKKSNLLLIAAVGNWGRADKPAYPAAYEHVVAVTATKGEELIYSHANQGDYVDFAAPGVGIYTAQPGGGGKAQSGTSFASPYITAMAAILAKAGKTPDAASLRKLLSTATRDLGRAGKDSVFGYGYVKARPACH